MSREEFDALLALLHPDREEAGRIYECIRTRLIHILERRGCTQAEDLTDETFNRVARKAAEGLAIRHSDPLPYIIGVANNVFQEWLRRKGKTQSLEPGDWPPAPPPEEEPDFRLLYIRRCLEILSAEQRRLVLRYYEDEQRIRSRKVLCEELGIPMNALRIRVHRLRKKVEACVKEKMQDRL